MPGAWPLASTSGAASQHDGPVVHGGIEPAGAVHQRPKYESKVWFSCTMITTCWIFETPGASIAGAGASAGEGASGAPAGGLPHAAPHAATITIPSMITRTRR